MTCRHFVHVDILYLNKQRLTAIEELSNAKKEIETLLEKVENLELQKGADNRKGDSLSIIKMEFECLFVFHLSSECPLPHC